MGGSVPFGFPICLIGLALCVENSLYCLYLFVKFYCDIGKFRLKVSWENFG